MNIPKGGLLAQIIWTRGKVARCRLADRRAKRVEAPAHCPGKDRQVYDEWFDQRYGRHLSSNIGRKIRRLRFTELWSTEDLQLFLCGKQFEGFEGLSMTTPELSSHECHRQCTCAYDRQRNRGTARHRGLPSKHSVLPSVHWKR